MRFNTRLSLCVIFVFRSLFFFEDFIFLSFLCAVIMTDTVLLAHPKSLAVSITKSPAKHSLTGLITVYLSEKTKCATANDSCCVTPSFLYNTTRVTVYCSRWYVCTVCVKCCILIHMCSYYMVTHLYLLLFSCYKSIYNYIQTNIH